MTQETLTLNLIPFIDSSTARSTRKVLVSLQRFSWSFQEVPHWVVCEMNRLSVPMMGDDAVALLAGLFELLAGVHEVNRIEGGGLKFDLLSFVHFDLDGRGANNVMVAESERTLDPKVFVSKRHCGSRATGLCEACMYSSVDETLIGWLCTCSPFLQTSGHFFRLVQVTAEGVRRYMDAPLARRLQF